MSISHRITGVFATSLIGGASIFYLISQKETREAVFAARKRIPKFAEFPLKFSIAFPFFYHSANGIRHLVMKMVHFFLYFEQE